MEKCKFCFKEISDEICPYCKKAQSIQPQTEYKLPPGTIIADRYIIGADIGEGGFGITYLAYDNKLEARCAVKEYYPHTVAVRNTEASNKIGCPENSSEYASGLIRFRNEAEKLSQFYSLKSIVNVRDYVEENNTGYIIMNYVEGISLKNYLDAHKGKISADEAFSMMEPIIHDLSIIQKEGIIHRDISPENIMVTEDNKLVLIDFGSAREYEDNKSLSIILKHGYAPPEQYISTGKQGPWTDVYSICATIYRAITGKAPDDSIDLMEKGSKAKLPSKLGARLPAAREDELMKGLELNYKERIQSCEELYFRLYTQNISSSRRRITPSFTAIAACAIVLVGVIAAIIGISGKNDETSLSAEGSVSSASQTTDNTESLPAAEVSESSVTAIAETVTVSETKETKYTGSSEEFIAPEDLLASGKAYNGIWQLSKDGTLYIDVKGEARKEDWTDHADSIKTVVLGNEVTKLKNKIFKGFSSIESVYFNDKLEKIGESCFEGCTALGAVDIPESVVSIGDHAFSSSGITSLNIHGAPEIEAYAFNECNALSEAYLGKAFWDKFAGYMFYNCSALESIIIPEGVEVINKHQFNGCSSLKEVTFPDTLTAIDFYAFYNCSSLEKVVFPDSLKTVGISAFRQCTSITEVVFSEKMEEIDEASFLNCDNLSNVKMPVEINTLDFSAFSYCDSLHELYLPERIDHFFGYLYSDHTFNLYAPDNFECIEYSVNSLRDIIIHINKDDPFIEMINSRDDIWREKIVFDYE